MDKADLNIEYIESLCEQIVQSKSDIYTFLISHFPKLSAEEHLQYLTAVLNDHFESYEMTGKEIKDEGCIIQAFMQRESNA